MYVNVKVSIVKLTLTNVKLATAMTSHVKMAARASTRWVVTSAHVRRVTRGERCEREVIGCEGGEGSEGVRPCGLYGRCVDEGRAKYSCLCADGWSGRFNLLPVIPIYSDNICSLIVDSFFRRGKIA